MGSFDFLNHPSMQIFLEKHAEKKNLILRILL